MRNYKAVYGFSSGDVERWIVLDLVLDRYCFN